MEKINDVDSFYTLYDYLSKDYTSAPDNILLKTYATEVYFNFRSYIFEL